MKLNPQYVHWLNGKSEGYDWVDVTNFLFIAHAELTDYNLSDKEVNKITEISEILFSSWIGEGVPYTDYDVKKKLKRAFDWYQSIQDTSEKSEIDKNLMNQVVYNANWLKSQGWFNDTFANSVLNWLLEISKADGILDHEIGSIRSLSQLWEVKSPI
jgi:hypothetical protein